MEVDEVDEVVDEIQTQVINKIQKIRANSSNPNYSFPVVTDDCSGRWPSSRIVRVSRASGGKDRHSKVVTSKGLRDRRIRLSVSTAIEFYDLQDRLGFDQPSKAVEWLINAASSSISELPSLDPPLNHQFSGRNNQMGDDNNNNSNSNSNSNNNNAVVSKVSVCSSTSETSKGSGHSRTENRIRARERARDRRKSPFTDLLTGGAVSPMDYFQPSQFNQPEHNGFSFSNFAPAGTTVASTGTGGSGLGSGLNRGTLQSNLVSCLPHQQHHLQSFQPLSMVDGSTSTNFHFLTSPFTDSFPTSGYDPSQRLQLYGGGDSEGRDSNDHYKGKSKT